MKWRLSGGGEMKAKGKREESGLPGLAIALQNASPAPKAIVREESPFIPTWALAFGAAALALCLAHPKVALACSIGGYALGFPPPAGVAPDLAENRN